MLDKHVGWTSLVARGVVVAICWSVLCTFNAAQTPVQQPIAPIQNSTWWDWLALDEQQLESLTNLGWTVMVPQRASAVVTTLGGGGGDELGWTNLSLSASYVRPYPWLEHSMLSVSPSMAMLTVDGPTGVPLPSELYRGSLTFSLIKPINEHAQLLLGMAPSFASDFEGGQSDAFRFMAFGSLTWQSTPTRKWIFGVAATGREDIPVLPMAGLIWTPNDDWRVEFTAPRPRVSRRVCWFDPAGSDWVYFAGEFGGGTWGVERAGGDDELTLRDFRLVLGWTRESKQAMNPHIEAGYVFGRKIEYESDGFAYEPANTFMVRAGMSL